MKKIFLVFLLTFLGLIQLNSQGTGGLEWMQEIIDSIEQKTDLCSTCSIAPNIKSYITPSGLKRFRFNSFCNNEDRTTIFYSQNGIKVAECILNNVNRECSDFTETTSFTFATNIEQVWDCEQGVNCKSVESKFLFENYKIIRRRNACQKQSTELLVSKPFDAYEWLLPDGQVNFNNKVKATLNGVYQVYVTNQYGCVDTSTIDIDITEPLGQPIIESEGPICDKRGTRLSLLGYQNYNWSTGQKLEAIDVFKADEYKVTVTNASGCIDSSNIELSDFSNYGFKVIKDEEEVFFGQELLLSLTSDNIDLNNSQLLFWKKGEQELSISNKEFSILVQDSTDYTAYIRSNEGCLYQATILIHPTGGPRQIYLPNVLSIKSNSGNNILFPELESGAGIVTNLSVYDRWGGLVFVRENQSGIDRGWNGLYLDKDLTAGVYLYSVDVRYLDGSESQFSSSVLLIN